MTLPSFPIDPFFSHVAEGNDTLRKTGAGGRIYMTDRVLALPDITRAEIMDRLERYDSFTLDNDPCGARDFGSFDLDCIEIVWTVQYYDPTFSHTSDDPSDPEITVRVLTIMLAEEY
jgi:hypothetical protein